MIIDLILLVLKGVLIIVLSPISVLNITIDLLTGIPVVVSFLQIVAYVIPWTNIYPIISFILCIFIFRIGIAFFKMLPIVGK